MILFDFATPAEQARAKVMLRPEDSLLFSPTRRGPAFSPQFDADEPVRRHRFARGIRQGDDGLAADSDVDLMEPDGPGEEALAQDEQAALADEAQAQDHPQDQPQELAQEAPEGLLAQEGAEAADAPVSEGATAEDTAPTEMQADTNTTLGEADAQVVAEGQAEHVTLHEDADEGVSEALDPDAPVDEPNLEAPDALDASTEDLLKQAFEAGYAAAKAELDDGSEPPNDGQPSPEAEDAAYLRGLEEGQRQTKDELAAEVLLAADDLKALAHQLAQAARDTETFYQPLLKLSTHLAEQLVRGELSLSGQAVTRLVERCLSEFQQETSAPIVVRMNPADHERHLAYGAMAPKNMDLRPDPSLSSGSVKVSMNGAMIEDLIEHRRQALWDALMSAAATPDDDLPDSFLRNVAIVKEAMASVDDEGVEPPAL
jgi:hypothetical protein